LPAPAWWTTGILDYYRQPETGTPDVYAEVNYQAGHPASLPTAAARVARGQLHRTPPTLRTVVVEVALREKPGRRKAARADASGNATSCATIGAGPVAALTGARSRVDNNATTRTAWDRAPDVLGRPVFDVLPEVGTPDVRSVLIGYQRPHIGPRAAHPHHHRHETVYWNLVTQPEFSPTARIRGIRSVGTEVTEQVRARPAPTELESRVQERTQECLWPCRCRPLLCRGLLSAA
jgi:hypothetical protein